MSSRSRTSTPSCAAAVISATAGRTSSIGRPEGQAQKEGRAGADEYVRRVAANRTDGNSAQNGDIWLRSRHCMCQSVCLLVEPPESRVRGDRWQSSCNSSPQGNVGGVGHRRPSGRKLAAMTPSTRFKWTGQVDTRAVFSSFCLVAVIPARRSALFEVDRSDSVGIRLIS